MSLRNLLLLRRQLNTRKLKMANELSIFRGDAASFAVALTLGGSPIDLDLYDTFFTVKKRLTDPDSSAVIRKNSGSGPSSDSGGIVITDASAGKLSIDLLHDDTKNLLGGETFPW